VRFNHALTIIYSLRIKRNKTYKFAVDQIQVSFSGSIDFQNNRMALPLATYFKSPKLKVIENSDDWITLCGEFTPSSCATFITIGNFILDDETIILPIEESKDCGPFAYYFIDDVVLYQIDSVKNCNISCDLIKKRSSIDIVKNKIQSLLDLIR
jgi:hypothetical protein